jgi:hypothetical protein
LIPQRSWRMLPHMTRLIPHVAVAIVRGLAIALSCGGILLAQQPETSHAFDHYVIQAEARINQRRSQANAFLKLDSLPAEQRSEMFRRLHQGEVVIEKAGNTPEEIPGGLIHDWQGWVFIPSATVDQVVSLIRDYDHLARYYSPDVLQSRLMSAHGDDLHVYMRLQKRKVVTVVLDTEYDVHYGRIDAAHQFSISRSTRVSEIENPGGPNEQALPQGHDHGYMWRLNSDWAFEQAGEGVLVQCEAISLTREIPTGLAWLIGPFVNSIPRESLQFTLTATRNAMAAKVVGAPKKN